MPIERATEHLTGEPQSRRKGRQLAGLSIVGLANGLAKDCLTLVRQEMELAETEILEKLTRSMRSITCLMIGCAVGYAGLVATVAALAIGYGQFLPFWFSTLLISFALFILSVMLIYVGRRYLQLLKLPLRFSASPSPKRATPAPLSEASHQRPQTPASAR